MQEDKNFFGNHQLEGKKVQNKHYDSQSKMEKILEKFYAQNEHFQMWAKQQQWETFHNSHYDYWAYPIDQNTSIGDEYKVTQVQIEILKKDKKFIQTLKRNAQLVCLSWGYKLKQNQFIPKNNCKQQQKWQNWPIRLYKMTRSLQIFQHEDYFSNTVKYGIFLINQNHSMQYGKRNLKEYFQSCEKKQKQQKSFKVI